MPTNPQLWAAHSRMAQQSNAVTTLTPTARLTVQGASTGGWFCKTGKRRTMGAFLSR